MIRRIVRREREAKGDASCDDCEGSTGLPRPVVAHTSRFGCAVRSKVVGEVVREDGGRSDGACGSDEDAAVSDSGCLHRQRPGRDVQAGVCSEEARSVVRPATVPLANTN